MYKKRTFELWDSDRCCTVRASTFLRTGLLAYRTVPNHAVIGTLKQVCFAKNLKSSVHEQVDKRTVSYFNPNGKGI